MKKKQNNEVAFKTSPLFHKNLAAFNDGYRIITNIGGSGSGKSYNVLMLLLYLVLNTETKLTIDICRKTFPTIKSTVLNDFIEILTEYKLFGMVDYNMTDSIFTFKKTDSKVRFYALDDALKLRGKKRDIIFIDEVNENDYETYSQLAMRTNQTIFLAMNPSEDLEHWIYNVIKDDTGKKSKSFHSTHLDNPFLSEGRRQELLDFIKVDYNKYLVYTLGLPPENNVRVYTHFKKYTDEPLNITSTAYGLDFGYTHICCLCRCDFVTDKLKVYAKELIFERKLTVADLIKRMDSLGISKQAKIYADGSRPEMIEEIKRAGYNIKAANKSVKDGIDYVKSKEVFIHENSTNAWNEFKTYTWIVKGEKITDEPNKAMDKDNFMDAFRYAVYSNKSATGSGVWDYEWVFA